MAHSKHDTTRTPVSWTPKDEPLLVSHWLPLSQRNPPFHRAMLRDARTLLEGCRLGDSVSPGRTRNPNSHNHNDGELGWIHGLCSKIQSRPNFEEPIFKRPRGQILEFGCTSSLSERKAAFFHRERRSCYLVCSLHLPGNKAPTLTPEPVLSCASTQTHVRVLGFHWT